MFRHVSSRVVSLASQQTIRGAGAAVPRTMGACRMGSAAAPSPAVAVAAAGDGKMPSIYDVTVKITFLDDEGNRRVVPGIVGKTLWETAQMHGIDIGPSSCGSEVEAVRSE